MEGVHNDPTLHRTLDTDLKPISIPDEGIVLSQNLADILRLNPGDNVRVEIMEGRRYERTIPVAGFAEQYLGLGAYMSLDAVNRLAGSGSARSGAFVLVGEESEPDLVETLQ